MKRILNITVLLIICALSICFSTSAEAAAKPNTTVPLDKVKLGSPSVKYENNKVKLSAAVKNKSKNTVKKVKVYYDVIIEYTEQVTERVTEQTTKKAPEQMTESVTTIAGEKETPQESVGGSNVAVQNETTATSVESNVSAQNEVRYIAKNVVKTKVVKVKATTKKIPKKKSSKVSGSAAFKSYQDVRIKSVSLREKWIYSGTGVIVYNKKTGKTKTKWGTKDKKAPVITGMIEHNSYYGNDCYITVFADQKNFKYSKYIKAYDDRDGEVKIKVDTKKVKWNKRGDYKVKITAQDKAGNKAKSWMKIHVEPKGVLCEMADDILKKIVKKSWSDEAKARAIYRYVKGHIRYIDSNTRLSWQKAAENSVRYGYGNCFNYYALSRLLFSRCGIPNAEITRYPASYGNHHWWNLVYVQGGWYHFDTTPRLDRSDYCLVTDAQRGDTYNRSIYPKRATKRL